MLAKTAFPRWQLRSPSSVGVSTRQRQPSRSSSSADASRPLLGSDERRVTHPDGYRSLCVKLAWIGRGSLKSFTQPSTTGSVACPIRSVSFAALTPLFVSTYRLLPGSITMLSCSWPTISVSCYLSGAFDLRSLSIRVQNPDMYPFPLRLLGSTTGRVPSPGSVLARCRDSLPSKWKSSSPTRSCRALSLSTTATRGSARSGTSSDPSWPPCRTPPMEENMNRKLFREHGSKL